MFGQFTDENGNPNISFRGSKTIKDWVVSDLAILTGNQQYDPRFKNSVKLTKEVKKKYENKPINITGHSLGGSISDYVNNNVNVDEVNSFFKLFGNSLDKLDYEI